MARLFGLRLPIPDSLVDRAIAGDSWTESNNSESISEVHNPGKEIICLVLGAIKNIPSDSDPLTTESLRRCTYEAFR